jgi:hypothetical protein
MLVLSGISEAEDSCSKLIVRSSCQSSNFKPRCFVQGVNVNPILLQLSAKAKRLMKKGGNVRISQK